MCALPTSSGSWMPRRGAEPSAAMRAVLENQRQPAWQSPESFTVTSSSAPELIDPDAPIQIISPSAAPTHPRLSGTGCAGRHAQCGVIRRRLPIPRRGAPDGEEHEDQLLARALADGLTESEALQTIRSAYSKTSREPLGTSCPSPATSPSTRRAAIAPMHSETGALPLPQPVDGGFVRLIDSCFRPDEFVAIAPAGESEDGEIVPRRGVTFTATEWKAKVEKKGGIDRVFGTKLGLFLRINPMRKDGATNEDVIAFRHVLVEFDRGQERRSDPEGGPVSRDSRQRHAGGRVDRLWQQESARMDPGRCAAMPNTRAASPSSGTRSRASTSTSRTATRRVCPVAPMAGALSMAIPDDSPCWPQTLARNSGSYGRASIRPKVPPCSSTSSRSLKMAASPRFRPSPTWG